MVLLILAIVLSHCRLIRSHWQLIYAHGVIIEAIGSGQQPHLPSHLPTHLPTHPLIVNILAANPLEREAALAAAPLTSFLLFGRKEIPDAGIPLP